MENKLYLIHEEDYVKHIDEGMVLYTMLKDITCRISKLPADHGDKKLADLAARAAGLPKKSTALGASPQAMPTLSTVQISLFSWKTS